MTVVFRFTFERLLLVKSVAIGLWRNTQVALVDPSLLEHNELYFNAARLDRSLVLKTSDYVVIYLTTRTLQDILPSVK
jgi:hypothetical protein